MPASHTVAENLDGLSGLSGYYPTNARVPELIGTVDRLFDVYWGGKGRVYGTVKVKGTPNYAVARRVRLFRDRDGLCVGETWSNAATGEYEFLYLDERERYTALAYDYTQNFRVVGADNLTAELML